MALPLLLDLGNRKLKCARKLIGAYLEERQERELPGPEDWTPFSTWLEVLASGGEVWVSSVNPRWLPRLLAGPLAESEVRVAGEEAWPFPVRSRGTGSDRILAARAAWHLASGPVLVADLGTAWTLDLMDGEGAFLGGVIGAGLGLQRAALREACPHLPPPLPGFAWGGAGIPSRSQQALAWGTAGALACALEGLAKRFERELGRPSQRFLCGGDAAVMAPVLGPAWRREDHLVLRGLALWGEGR